MTHSKGVDTYRGPATLAKASGEQQAVAVTLDLRQDMIDVGGEEIPGMMSWSGQVTSAADLWSWIGDGVTIELDNGRSGDVIVLDTNGRLAGSGPAPFGPAD